MKNNIKETLARLVQKAHDSEVVSLEDVMTLHAYTGALKNISEASGTKMPWLTMGSIAKTKEDAQNPNTIEGWVGK